jgi:hypothetical protein
MDDLCRLMNRSSLICIDENNEKLIAAYEETKSLLQKDAVIKGTEGVLQNQMSNYLSRCHYRYKEYLQKIHFKRHFAYLEELILDFIEKCLIMQGRHVDRHEFRYLLMLSFYIDSSLLETIGILSIDKD